MTYEKILFQFDDFSFRALDPVRSTRSERGGGGYEQGDGPDRSVRSAVVITRHNRAEVLFCSFQVTSTISTEYTIALSLSLYLRRMYRAWRNRSRFLICSHVSEHVLRYLLVFTRCVLSIAETHTHTTKLLMIKVCTRIAKTIEASQMKHIDVRRRWPSTRLISA